MFVLLSALFFSQIAHAHEPMQTKCHSEESEFGSKSWTSALELEGDRMIVEEFYYRDATCSDLMWEKTWGVDLSLGKVLNDLGDVEVDQKYLGVGIRASTVEMAQEMSKSKFCGFELWEFDVFQDVSGKKCGCQKWSEPKIGEIVFSVMRKHEHEIVLGLKSLRNSGKTPERRMRSLDWKRHYREHN